MLFSSYEFIFLFLPMALGATFFVARTLGHKAALICLLLMSLLFYSWWNPGFLIILAFSMAVNFSAALFFDPRFSQQLRKIILSAGLLFNLALLWYYKYAPAMLADLGWHPDYLPRNDVGLPLAISFFTFQQIAYLVDAYRLSSPQKSILPYMLFLTFFPHLISGPIVRDREIIPQFLKQNLFVFIPANFYAGLLLFSIGLAKKTILADSLSVLATSGWDNVAQISMAEGWIVTIAWTLQLYFDFSAYSDMAVGIALMFNLLLPINFQSPYRASSIIDLWQRWHMTLTRWVNHYLYRPLLRSRKTFNFTYAMLVTILCMTIIGVWHGAAWSYVIFGVVHGMALVINHIWRKYKFHMSDLAGRLTTFLFITLAMILNTSRSKSDILGLYNSLFNIESKNIFVIRSTILDISDTAWVQFLLDVSGRHAWVSVVSILALIVTSLVIVFFPKNSNDITEAFKPRMSYALLTVALFLAGLMCINGYRPFHYFQF
jgi:alginate O-acetyltransferase complex protein AlgI